MSTSDFGVLDPSILIIFVLCSEFCKLFIFVINS